MPVNLESQFEFTVKASLGEDAFQEGDEEPLVKLIIDAATIDGLSHQGLQSSPGDLVRSDILPTLRGDMFDVTYFCFTKLIPISSVNTIQRHHFGK